jgi:hypothetical protein
MNFARPDESKKRAKKLNLMREALQGLELSMQSRRASPSEKFAKKRAFVALAPPPQAHYECLSWA